MNNDPFSCTKLFQKRGHYSKENIVQGGGGHYLRKYCIVKKFSSIYKQFSNLIFFCRKFTKEFKVPEGVLKEQLQSSYSSEGILTIHAPRKINAPEGAEVQEAMAAASKAFTTDDGKNHSLKSKSRNHLIFRLEFQRIPILEAFC